MLFNSLEYAIFLPIVFSIYWFLPHKYRWILILISSYYFYMSWNAKYALLILSITIISFISAILFEKIQEKSRKKFILFLSIFICISVLFFFKYFNFFYESIYKFISSFRGSTPLLSINIILPVGISFYTFQCIGYVVDVYRGDIEAEHHFGKFAAFIAFFPQLVAGPIERSSNLLPQIKEEHYFDYTQATYGLKLMAWGFFKKLVIADVLSNYVQTVFVKPQNFHGFALILSLVFFSIQIYCDFSGYSDIAIGTAKLFGINLMTNFRSPYFSTTITEVWRRWHISLSTWFRDYVYIPLGGSRCSKYRNYANILITFLLSGLWHGANWTFVIWGGIHGVIQVIEKAFKIKEENSGNLFVHFLRILLTFSIFVLALTFFISNSISDASYVILHSFDGITQFHDYLYYGFHDIGLQRGQFIKISVSVLLLAVYDYCSLKTDCIADISKLPVAFRYSIYWAIILAIVFLKAAEPTEFVYFQF